jgi:hypothetical protein
MTRVILCATVWNKTFLTSKKVMIIAGYRLQWVMWANKCPLHCNHLLVYCASPYFYSARVLNLLWSTVSCIMESYHGCLVPLNVHLSNKIFTQLNPHTHMRHVRLFRFGSYRLHTPLCNRWSDWEIMQNQFTSQEKVQKVFSHELHMSLWEAYISGISLQNGDDAWALQAAED